MTVLKRSQLALLSVGFMLLVAGYINYKYNPQREKNLGQTVYVNGKDSFEYEDVSIYSEGNKNVGDNVASNSIDDSIAVFRYDRDNMFSELTENYNNVINNVATTPEVINEYQKKLNELITEKNLIAMVENVIRSKGINDVVIIPTNNDNINVVIKLEGELKDEKIAQIHQILVDQLGAKAEKISITCKN